MKTKTLILAIFLSYTVLKITGKEETITKAEEKYGVLADAVFLHESGGDTLALNEAEQAYGAFQIRQCKLDDYNRFNGTNYTLKDCYNYQLSRKIFMYFAQGKTWEKAARNWNGRWEKTLEYWQNVQKKFYIQVVFTSKGTKIVFKKTQKHKKMNVSPNSSHAYKLLHDGLLAFARAERQGIRLDVDYINSKRDFLIRKMERFERKFKDSSFYKEWKESQTKDVNIDSPKQLSNFLYKVKGYTPVEMTESEEEGSTSKEALKKLGIPDLDLLITRDKYAKLIKTLEGFLREEVDGFIHPFFNLNVAVTYRGSSQNPNFQNIPVRDEESLQICRGAIFPRYGHQFLEADFKSIEVSVAACYNKDPNLIKYCSDPTTDMHRDMAQQIFFLKKFDKNINSHTTLRKAAKNGFVFPQFYGDYFKNNAISLAVEWGKLPQGKWKEHQGIDMVGWDKPVTPFFLSDHLRNNGITELGDYFKDKNGKYIVTGFMKHIKEIEEDFWENRFPGYARWKDKWYSEYLRKGYIDLYTGFRCHGPMTRNQCTNYPVQGTAFTGCLLKSFIEIDRISQEEKWDSQLIGQIHDSMIVDCHPKELEYVAKTIHRVTCENLPKLYSWIIVPLEIELEVAPVDCSWAEKDKYKLVA